MSEWKHDYESLKTEPPEFRLVTLEPGKQPDFVQVSLAKYTLNDHPLYEALSYVWGPYDLDDPYLIELNGYGFEVTVNLSRALYSLRSETVKRVLWIDAIW